jgi:hypothetical protein
MPHFNQRDNRLLLGHGRTILPTRRFGNHPGSWNRGGRRAVASTTGTGFSAEPGPDAWDRVGHPRSAASCRDDEPRRSAAGDGPDGRTSGAVEAPADGQPGLRLPSDR